VRESVNETRCPEAAGRTAPRADAKRGLILPAWFLTDAVDWSETLSPRRKNDIANAVFFCTFILVPSLAESMRWPPWTGITPAVLTIPFALFWRLMFCCPQCGTPLLWSVSNGIVWPRVRPPRHCKQCGLATDEPR
jgi:hypothetical protein